MELELSIVPSKNLWMGMRSAGLPPGAQINMCLLFTQVGSTALRTGSQASYKVHRIKVGRPFTQNMVG